MPSFDTNVQLRYSNLQLTVYGRYTYDRDDSTFEPVKVELFSGLTFVDITTLVEDTVHWVLLEEACREKLDQQHGTAPEFAGFKEGE